MNRTSYRPVLSVIILVINKSDFRFAVVRLCLSLVRLQTELDSTRSYYHYWWHWYTRPCRREGNNTRREIYLFRILFTTLLRRVLQMNFVVAQFPTQTLKLSDWAPVPWGSVPQGNFVSFQARNKTRKVVLVTLYTLTSECIFSTLFFIHFLRCWQGEFVCQSKDSFASDHFLYSHDLNVWFRSDIVGRK